MMEEEGNIEACKKAMEEEDEPRGLDYCFWGPIYWFKMLAMETHWSFVFGVVSVYGISQGLGGALARVGTEYYMKDVQKVQPSESQVYTGITYIPWIIKPIWGGFLLMLFQFEVTEDDLTSFCLRAFARHKKYITPNKRHMFPYFLNSSLPEAEAELNRIIRELHHESLRQPEVRSSKAGRDVTKYPVPECMCNNTM